jgi:hypothetical protein
MKGFFNYFCSMLTLAAVLVFVLSPFFRFSLLCLIKCLLFGEGLHIVTVKKQRKQKWLQNNTEEKTNEKFVLVS